MLQSPALGAEPLRGLGGGLRRGSPRLLRAAGCQLLPDERCAPATTRLAAGQLLPRARTDFWVPLAAVAGLPTAAALRHRQRRPKRRSRAVTVWASGPEAPEGATWSWRGREIFYRVAGPESGPAVLLLHGFGVSSLTYRRTLPALASAGYRAYALDMLGFGGSSKATDVAYSTGLWAELAQDFCKALSPGQPVVLGGNSIGSVVALIAASSAWGRGPGGVRGLLLFNCGAGMNSKFLATSDFLPPPLRLICAGLFAVFDLLLGFRPLAELVFNGVATNDNVSGALQAVYVKKSAVDQELVEGVCRPARDEGALDVFTNVLTGDPGPTPLDLVPSVSCPIKVIWGDVDTVTPIDGLVGGYFQRLAESPPAGTAAPPVAFTTVSAGHVPMDDDVEAVNVAMLKWLEGLPGPKK